MDLTTTDVPVGDWTIRTHQAGDPADPTILAVRVGPRRDRPVELARAHHRCRAATASHPTLLGFGDSSHPDRPAAGRRRLPAMRAEAMSAARTLERPPRTHLVGSSMGHGRAPAGAGSRTHRPRSLAGARAHRSSRPPT